MTRDDRLRIAVFIDFDNIEIGVKNTLGASFDAGLVLEALKERGDVVSKTAYSDWQRAGGYSRSLTQHAIKMVQRNLTPGGDKNGADINLALDALEMAFTHPHINAFVIVGGDSDFISLVEKLKQYDKKIFVVGGRQFTSIIMQKNCHEFIAYENLVGASSGASSSGGRRQSEPGRVRVERVPIEQAIPLVTRGLKVLADREVSPQLGLLKSTLLQLDSTFSERSYGAGSFRDFVEKLEKLGVLKLQQVKGGLLVTAGDDAPMVVEPSRSLDDGDQGAEAGDRAEPAEQPVDQSDRHRGREPRGEESGMTSDAGAAPAQAGSMADGLKEFREILASGQVRRWPMYLRNVKQLIKQVKPAYDERAYGFANLVDLLRAAGRDGLVRVDRDRQGVIRVFQGTSAPVEAQPSAPKIFDIEDELAEAAAAAAAAAPMPIETESPTMRGDFNSSATSDDSDDSADSDSSRGLSVDPEDEDEGDSQRSLLPAAQSDREVDGNRAAAKLDTPGHALARGRARRPPRTGRSSAAATTTAAKPAATSKRAAAPRARKTTRKG